MIKLQKNKWNKVALRDVCENVQNVSSTNKKGTFTYIEIGAIEDNKIIEYKKENWNTASPNAKQVVFKDDVLCSTVRVNLKKIARVDKELNDGIATVGFCVIRADRKKTIPQYLFFNCLSDSFTEKLLLFSSGTTYPIVKNKDVLNVEIPLPPLPEQTQIAELFQSIETAIEQAEQQEKNLLKLKKTLSNGLLNNEPEFGNLLNPKNCTPTNFGGVVDCIEQHDKQKKDVTYFIGLENIEPENLKISTWGNVADGTTFTKRFSKGDILFGKRRAYLKKVAIADFEGICSGDILVLRAKGKNMLKELLPFYVSAEPFINHAVSTSAGSLSPRTKWKDLSLFEFSIPDLKAQGKILEVFQQIETILWQTKTQKQTLKNLKQKLLNEILG
jgi:type I restriction enzyme S subunit